MAKSVIVKENICRRKDKLILGLIKSVVSGLVDYMYDNEWLDSDRDAVEVEINIIRSDDVSGRVS